jgi:hypothetical protein
MEVYCSGYRTCKTWWRGVPRASGPACVPGTNLVVLVHSEAWVLCQMVDIGQCLYIYFVLLDCYHLCLYFALFGLMFYDVLGSHCINYAPFLQYYMRTGTCKFGASCKYHHPRQGEESVTPVSLNCYGYPLRPVCIPLHLCLLFLKK